MKQKRLILAWGLLIIFGLAGWTTIKISKNDAEVKGPVFEKIDSRYSGIKFSNSIRENVATDENLFDYDYFYNGAGVGVSDLNNDGLDDLFFCGNQVENRLYLNKGNLKFEDISSTANINSGKHWSSGVTFADVNADGWMDIYISQGGPFAEPDRANLLFINQKNMTFRETAGVYGLGDTGISTQSAFFDYDQDGDLDCYVMNENELYGVEPMEFYDVLGRDENLLYKNSSHLYKNENGKFIDVTKAAGLLSPAFGLGLVISDINNDRWPDIYQANDYFVPDMLYINQKNGTFSNEIKTRTSQVSFYGMGADIADINNDGNQDIYVLDMASDDHMRSKTLMRPMNAANFNLLVQHFSLHYQYMFNTFQLNLGNDTFVNIAQMAGLAKTDWSWAGLMADLDNDGRKDIYVTNGYRRYAVDNDFGLEVKNARMKYNNKVPLEIKQQLYQSMPSEKLVNKMYWNTGNLYFKDVAESWGMNHPSFSNGATFADLDLDGDLEYVVSNMDEEAFLYKNLTREKKLGNYLRVKAIGKSSENLARVIVKNNGTIQMHEYKRVRGYLSAVENTAHFGIGLLKKIDTVRIEWPSGLVEEKYNVSGNSVIEFHEADAKPFGTRATLHYQFESVSPGAVNLAYHHIENSYNDFEKEILLPYKQSTLGPAVTIGDVNGDSQDDIYMGGPSGQPGQLFIQLEGKFVEKISPAFEADFLSEDMESVFFDADSDGDQDLFVVSGGNEFEPNSSIYRDRLYRNDGKGNFSTALDAGFNGFNQSGKSVCTIDYDKDGDLDLIVGNRIVPQNYPRAAPSFLFQNSGGQFKDVTSEVAPALSSFGIVNKVISTDFNNDGWPDFIVVGEWTSIGLFQNTKGLFANVSEESNLTNDLGWWFTVAETDVNKDGMKDYIIGNVGLNTKFKASTEKAFKVFVNDFDSNGSPDIVLSSKYNEKYVPVRGRECSSQQMPFIAKKFPTYQAFAKADLVDIYGDRLASSYQLSATEFQSVLLINKGKGKFEKVVLPVEAQMSPIMSVRFYDTNADGYDDAILAGNIYDTEVETPRLDAGAGVILLSDHKRNYSPLLSGQSGFFLKGDVKYLALIHLTNRQPVLIAGVNNGPLQIFKIHRK